MGRDKKCCRHKQSDRTKKVDALKGLLPILLQFSRVFCTAPIAVRTWGDRGVSDEFLKGHSIATPDHFGSHPPNLKKPAFSPFRLPLRWLRISSRLPRAHRWRRRARPGKKSMAGFFFSDISYVRFHIYGKVEPKKEKKIPHSAVGLGWTPGVWRRSCPWKTSCRGQEEDGG